MALYNMDSEYNGEKLTYTSLCQELMDENDAITGDFTTSVEYYRDKIKNSKKNGVIDKLNSLLGTDIEEIARNADEPEKEKFNLFKLVKEIYYIEKNGSPKYSVDDNKRVLITDILRKPRLENIKTDFSVKSIYGEYFENLYNTVKSQVSDADTRKDDIFNINLFWEYITDILFDYVITDTALDNPSEAIRELERINRFLEVRILGRLSLDNIPVTYEIGVLENFFNLLVSHKVMCRDIDRLNINYRICETTKPSEEYVKLFKDRENYTITRNNISILEDYICGETDNDKIGEILQLILLGLDKKYYDVDACRFAIKHYDIVLKWWTSGKDVNLQDEVPIELFIVVMQELIVVYKDKEGLRNDYVGYNNPKRSLVASVRKPSSADAVAVQAWIKKLENRMVVNFGGFELIKKKREIENTIYRIKQYIFAFLNLEDMKFVNSCIYYMASRSMICQKNAEAIGYKFAENVARYLSNRISDVTFLMPSEGINVFNMFKDFAIDKSDAIDKAALEMAEMINQVYEDDSICAMGCKLFIEISWNEKSHKNSMLTYWIDKDHNRIEYKQYVGVEADSDCERMKKLGLGKFIVDDNPNVKFY